MTKWGQLTVDNYLLTTNSRQLSVDNKWKTTNCREQMAGDHL